jgi:hypothetical protein
MVMANYLSRYLLLILLLPLLLTVSLSAQSEDNLSSEVEAETAITATATAIEQKQEQEKSWWQRRQNRSDIFYPHKPHIDIMEKGGDACMLCHPFNAYTVGKNNVDEEQQQLKSLREINNEPLEAICHDCHLEKINAPAECALCHPNPATVWPQDHNYNYIKAHAEDARFDQDGCSDKCHKQLSFCTDCHFKRNFSGTFSGINVHKPGYKTLHGLDARISPLECGSCHQANYCSDCHRRSK